MVSVSGVRLPATVEGARTAPLAPEPQAASDTPAASTAPAASSAGTRLPRVISNIVVPFLVVGASVPSRSRVARRNPARHRGTERTWLPHFGQPVSPVSGWSGTDQRVTVGHGSCAVMKGRL